MKKTKKKREWKARVTGTQSWTEVPGWNTISFADEAPDAHLDLAAVAESAADAVLKCRSALPDEIRIDLMDPKEMVVYDILIDVSWDPVFECTDMDVYASKAVKG